MERTSAKTTIALSRETWLRLQAIATPFRGSDLGTPEKVIEHLLDSYEDEHAPPAADTCPHCSAELTDTHPASRADGKLEGECPTHGHVVAA